MGFLDRFRRPAPTGGGTGRHTFAATRVDLSVRPDRRALARTQPWQRDAWTVYETNGEAGYIVDFFGHALSRIRIFPAGIDDPEQGRVPLDEVDGFPAEIAARAQYELDRIRHVQHGQGEILSQMAISLKVPGEGHLAAYLNDDGVECWDVASTDALTVRGGRYVIRRWESDRDGRVLTDQDFLMRFWRQSPRWPGVATSEMKRILGHAEGLQLVERSLRSASRSRIAGAGMVLFPTEANLGGVQRGDSGGIVRGGDFLADWMEAAMASIADEGSVAGFVPLPVEIPGQFIEHVKHIDFARAMTEVEERREKQLLIRIAQGLDSPPELVTGMADVNHWTAWQVEDSTYQAHLEPLVLTICDILAAGVIRPALLGAGYPGPIVDQVMLGADASDLLTRPNRPTDAKDAHDKLVISDASLRKELKFTDADAPDEAEVLRRMALKRGITTEALTRELLREYANADVADPADIRAEEAAAEGTAADGSSTPDTGTRTTSGDDTTEAVAGSAAPSTSNLDTLGSTLATIDATLADRLLVAADAAIDRAVERAGNRLRSRLRRGELASRLRDVPTRDIARTIGQTLAVELGVGPDDAVTDDDFTPLHDRWTTWVTDAQADATTRTADAVDVTDQQRTQLEARQDEDRDAGWLVLVASLLTLTRAAIFDPEPTAVTDGELGITTVPAGTVREALAVAGGAAGQPTAGGAVLVDAGTRPAGGVATGERILALVNDAGATLVGWSWRYGNPSRSFEPHRALDGTTFSSWTDEVLSNSTGEWPYVTHFQPGDHRGCSCWTAPAWELDPARVN